MTQKRSCDFINIAAHTPFGQLANTLGIVKPYTHDSF